jgi:hypothetical protein
MIPQIDFMGVTLALMVYSCLAVGILGQFFILWAAWLNSKPLFYGLIFCYALVLFLFYLVII